MSRGKKKYKGTAKLDTKRARRNLKIRLLGMTDNQVAEVVRVTGDGFLYSQEWRALRQKVIDKYGGRCMRCGFVPDKGINVDHIKPRRYFPELALDESNLQCLCRRCNKAKGNKDMTDWRGKIHGDELDEDQSAHIRSILKE